MFTLVKNSKSAPEGRVYMTGPYTPVEVMYKFEDEDDWIVNVRVFEYSFFPDDAVRLSSAHAATVLAETANRVMVGHQEWYVHKLPN